VRLFNQTHCSLSARRLRRLQRRGGGFFAHAEGQTSACNFRTSGRGCRIPTTTRTGTLLVRLFNQTRRFRPFALLPCLQRRDGGLSPHARSVIPAGCFLLGGWRVCSSRRADFVRSLPTSPSHARWQYSNSCLVYNTCM
jgi:hypothetical protein